jgi:hypothetical protein
MIVRIAIMWMVIWTIIIRSPPPVVMPIIIIGRVVISWIIIRIAVIESPITSIRITYSYINACIPVIVVSIVIVVVIIFEITVIGCVFVAIGVIYFCTGVNNAVCVGHCFRFFVCWLSFWFLRCVFAVICLIIILRIAADA